MNTNKRKEKKSNKKLSDKQIFLIIICVSVFIILGYTVRGIYYNFTGSVKSEIVNYVTENIKVNVEGVVIRDEAGTNGKDSLLKKSSNATYSPIVSDGECVAKNQEIAYIFDKETDASNFRALEEVKNNISLLNKLQDTKNIGYLDLSMLNSEIASSVTDIVYNINKNDLSNLDSDISNLSYKITSKQIITGEKVKLKTKLNELNKRKRELEKSIGHKQNVTSPIAGYFASNVDGYETVFDYKSISENGLTVDEVNKLKKAKSKNSDNYFGKIISEHAWYFTFNLSYLKASSMKVNQDVYVSFPDKNVTDAKMKVSSIKRQGKNVAIVLKCMTMNDNMLNLRKENAVITIASYYGLKISKSALKSYNTDGIKGVFAYVGNCALFKPIDIIYNAEDYVIAKPIAKFTDDPEEAKKDETIILSPSETGDETTVNVENKKILKAYDKIIVKGRNLYDGKVIG